MRKITEEQVSVAYQVSKDVFAGNLRRSEGIVLLSNKHGLNKASAGDFINCFKCMVEGRIFQRSMSHSAMDYFLKNIATDFSVEYLSKSVDALAKHIEYWETHYKTNALSMRKVAEHYREISQAGLTAGIIQKQLEQNISESLKLSSSERLQRISTKDPKPKQMTVSTTVYQRNHDVVAERLSIADGVCEKCCKDAPFLRSKDGTPYLEVHHIEKLSDGGLDTLENTIAVCPNCHREMHFG